MYNAHTKYLSVWLQVMRWNSWTMQLCPSPSLGPLGLPRSAQALLGQRVASQFWPCSEKPPSAETSWQTWFIFLQTIVWVQLQFIQHRLKARVRSITAKGLLSSRHPWARKLITKGFVVQHEIQEHVRPKRLYFIITRPIIEEFRSSIMPMHLNEQMKFDFSPCRQIMPASIVCMSCSIHMTRNCNSEKHVYTCPIHWGLSHGPLQTGVCTGPGPWEGFEVSFDIWDVGKDWVAVWQGMMGKDFGNCAFAFSCFTFAPPL